MNSFSFLQGLVSRLRRLGRLRHRLVIERVHATPDEAGGWQTDYQSVGAVWAEIRPVGAEPSLAPRQSGETLTHEIMLRYREDVHVGHRFRQGTACYVIRLLVDPDQRKTWLVCLCTQERA